MYQARNQSRQDPLNYLIKLSDKLAHLNTLGGAGDFRPAEQAYQARQAFIEEIDKQPTKFYLKNPFP